MITYNAITSINPERDVLRCLPECPESRQQLLEFQGSFGIGAYDNKEFVGSLWHYLIHDPAIGNPFAPDWTGFKPGAPGYNQLTCKTAEADYPLVCLGCFHVGRTKKTEATDQNDPVYIGKGIGTGILQAAIEWAKRDARKSILAVSGIDNFPEFNNWAGLMPLKVFMRNGFEVLDIIDGTANIPGHLRPFADEHADYKQAIAIKRLNSK